MTDSFLKTQSKISLQWNNLSLIDKKTDKFILRKLSGQVNSGQFLTVMGPSGAGKSSFLSIITSKLSSYASTFKIQGKTTLNNNKYTENQFILIASYVQQDDLLMETLTVEQTLSFQARLKLSDISDEQRQLRVRQILKLLNLYEIRNAKVGGHQTKSISGGQKKRVAIGVQLISNPLILILDEPTSGLDSFNSFKIIKILSNLAKQQNKLIIATIHQPSSLMFQNFDKLMVLKSGRQVYHNHANKMIEYMKSLKIKIDQRMNPADFFMLELSSFKQMQGHQTSMTAQKWQNYQRAQKKGINKSIINNQLQKIDFNQHPPTKLIQQFQPLLIRNLKTFIRTPSNQFGRLMQMICYPMFIGVLFYDLLDKFPQDISNLIELQLFLTQFASCIYLGMFFTIGIAIYDTMLVFPTQKQLILKQVHGNMYSLNMYFIVKLIIQIPCLLIPTWITTTIVFFIIGFQNTFSNWLLYELIFSVIALSGYLIGICGGILCKGQQIAVQASPFIITLLVVFGGLIVNLNTLPDYSNWIKYLTPLSYGYNLLMRSQLSTSALHNIGGVQIVRQMMGLSNKTNQGNIIEIILLCYGLLVLSFLTLYFRRKFS